MESLPDDNLNPDNDHMYTVTTCRCLIVQTLCSPSPFSSSVVGNKLSSDTVHAHCAHSLQSFSCLVLKFSRILKFFFIFDNFPFFLLRVLDGGATVPCADGGCGSGSRDESNTSSIRPWWTREVLASLRH